MLSGPAFNAFLKTLEEPRRGGLADPAGAREEIGVRDAPGHQRIAQRSGHRLLPDDRVELLRPPLPGQDLVGHAGDIMPRTSMNDRAPSIEPSAPRSPSVTCSGQVLPRHTGGAPYRCSLPGLAGFDASRCVGPNLQRRPVRLIQHRRPSKREFNPAIADCGLQGTATSPSSTATRRRLPIRAHLLRWRRRQPAQRTESTPRGLPSGAASQLTPSRRPTRSRAHRTSTPFARERMAEGVGFEPTVQLPVHGISSAAPSATRPPLRASPALLKVRIWRRGEDLNPRGTCAPIRFRVGRLQPGSATPPRLMSRSLRRYLKCPSVAAGRGRVHPYGEPPPGRFARKKSLSRAPHSSARTPAVTSTR